MGAKHNKIKERNTQKGVASTVTNVVYFLELDEKSLFRCLFSAVFSSLLLSSHDVGRSGRMTQLY
jgi:hypothetical protein